MKIGCPTCGQHYEVDASMLDRYFRCTECKTLFLGLNAKSVKPVKYKRKGKKSAADCLDSELDGAEKLLDNTGELPEENEELLTGEANTQNSGNEAANTNDSGAEINNDTQVIPVLTGVKFDSEDDVEPLQALSRLNWTLYGMLATAALSVILLIALCVCTSKYNARITALEKHNDSCRGFGEKLEMLERRQESIPVELYRLRERLEKVEQIENRLNNRIADESTANGRKLQAVSAALKEQNNKFEAVVKMAGELEEVIKYLNETEKNSDNSALQRSRRRR